MEARARPGAAGPTAATGPALSIDLGGHAITIRPLGDMDEAAACAAIMTLFPFTTLFRFPRKSVV